MTNCLVFATEAEALAAEANISQELGLPRCGVCASTGQMRHDACHTERWAIPRETLAGDWVFASHDGSGVPYDPAWFPVPDDLI